ncbi:endonuclease [Mycoplasma sp. 2704]|uniref:endonuclease n=1 Tax=unclassified Mycoplasma TaxID=2683645 RepID=UPI002B1E3E94|nr:endonuclease [Mycoplasma sp. 2704]MEA4134538.1 endonuclease [Mycoplasma sp. 2704]
MKKFLKPLLVLSLFVTSTSVLSTQCSQKNPEPSNPIDKKPTPEPKEPVTDPITPPVSNPNPEPNPGQPINEYEMPDASNIVTNPMSLTEENKQAIVSGLSAQNAKLVFNAADDTLRLNDTNNTFVALLNEDGIFQEFKLINKAFAGNEITNEEITNNKLIDVDSFDAQTNTVVISYKATRPADGYIAVGSSVYTSIFTLDFSGNAVQPVEKDITTLYNNILVSLPLSGDLKTQVLAKLNAHENIAYMYTDRTVGLDKKKGPAFLKFKSEFENDEFQLVNDVEKEFTYKNKKYPNSFLNYEYNAQTQTLTVKYKLTVRNEDKTFDYSNDNLYTSVVKLNIVEESSIEESVNGSDNPSTPPSSGNGETPSNPNPEPSQPTQPVTANGLRYDASNNYYAQADGKMGDELYDALLTIQNSHFGGVRSYGALGTFYDQYNAFKDKYFEKDNTLLDIYSENPNGRDPYTFHDFQWGKRSSARDEGEGTNKEHLIPQSWFNKESPMVSDAHHVWPTDIKVNANRGNFPHDNVNDTAKTSRNGGKLGRNSIGETTFEPIDAFKGDIARAYLYFTVTYRNRNLNQKSNSIFSNTKPYIKDHYYQTYKNWVSTDSISQFDIDRNNETARYQGGLRNPFIDYPDLIDSLEGRKPFVNRGILVGLENS